MPSTVHMLKYRNIEFDIIIFNIDISISKNIDIDIDTDIDIPHMLKIVTLGIMFNKWLNEFGYQNCLLSRRFGIMYGSTVGLDSTKEKNLVD